MIKWIAGFFGQTASGQKQPHPHSVENLIGIAADPGPITDEDRAVLAGRRMTKGESGRPQTPRP